MQSKILFFKKMRWLGGSCYERSDALLRDVITIIVLENDAELLKCEKNGEKRGGGEGSRHPFSENLSIKIICARASGRTFSGF